MTGPGNTPPRRRRDERGVSAILVALLLVPMLGFVAMAVDISSLNNTRQKLWDTLDASALAGAALLPDGVAARDAALAYADANLPGLVPAIEFWCVVGVGSGGGVDDSGIPAACNPGPAPYTVGQYPGLACNSALCAIPCNPLPPSSDSCNTMSVAASRTVPFAFAPVIGFEEGNTGTLVTASCKGPCGISGSAPADIALVVDRTGSMRSQDVAALKAASLGFLEGLTPALHDVALGTLGRSKSSPGSCPTTASTNAGSGPWVPVSLRHDYDLTDNTPPDNPPNLNLASDLVKGINCLSSSGTGTNLGDPIAAAGDHLLDSGREGVSKGIVFMTDGEANKPAGNPCSYAESQAAAVEASDITIVTIAYRLQGVSCGVQAATTVLAHMASDPPTGPPTADDGGDGPGGLPGGCATAASVAGENADGDNFLCAADESQLVAVFSAASNTILLELNERTRLVSLPR